MRAIALVLFASLFACSDGRETEIAPAGELREQSLSAVDRPTIRLDPEKVPPELRDLIPYAEQWGIGDDGIRGDYEESTSEAEKLRLQAALRGRTAQVQAWLDSLPPERFGSDETGAFLFMLEALEEMGLTPE